jgi:ABC-type glycerol-3-phosphate transport system substrate-binding protein
MSEAVQRSEQGQTEHVTRGAAAEAGWSAPPRTRRLLLGGLIGTMGAVAAACGAASSTGGTTNNAPGVSQAAPTFSKAPVTIEEWDWHATTQAAQYQPMVDTFQKFLPNVTLNWVGVGSADILNKVTVAVAGGNPPDIAYMDNQHQGFYGKQKLLVDQAPLAKLEKNFHPEVIDAKALALYTYNGTQLGYPWLITTCQVEFNRDLFKAAGQPTPDEMMKQGKWTWDTMAQLAIALNKRNPDGTIQILGVAQQSVWRLALQSNNSDYFDDPKVPKKSRLDEPQAIDAVQYIADLAQKWQVGWREPEATQLGGNDNNAFNANKVAMLVRHGVPGQWPDVMPAVWAVPFPKGPDAKGTFITDLTTESAGMMQGAKHHDAAWQFCRWYHQDWQRQILLNALPRDARVPSRTDLNDIAKKALANWAELWFEFPKYGVLSRPVNPDWNKMSTDIINPGLNPVFAGQRAAKDGATVVAKQLNDFLAANPQ